jgi:hypothetical protein
VFLQENFMNRSSLQKYGNGVRAVRESGFLSRENCTKIGIFDFGNLHALIGHYHDILRLELVAASEKSEQQHAAMNFAHGSHSPLTPRR